MEKERFQMRVAVHLILFKDGQTLLLRRFNTGWRDGEYSVIAGHVDGKETITHSTMRETKEEAGIDVTEEKLQLVHTMHRTNEIGIEYIDLFLTTDEWKGEPRVMEIDKCDEIAWYPLNNLPANMVPYIKLAIENINARVPFSEYKEPVAHV